MSRRLPILDLWARRTDDARRTKGDPPPTYAQLLAEIRATQAALATATDIATALRSQVDGLTKENARLRARALPLLTLDPPVLWTCPVEGHTRVTWFDNVAHCTSPGCENSSADDEPVVDEDVTRPYIPEWHRYTAADGLVPKAGKDEQR